MHVLARMFWGFEDDDARYLADAVDPACFLSVDRRELFVQIAHAAARGSSPVSFRAHIQAVQPRLIPLLDELIGEAGNEGMFDQTSREALAESIRDWSVAEKFRRAVAHAADSIKKGEAPAEVRSTLDRHLMSIDTSAITERKYDDMEDMLDRVKEHLSTNEPQGLRFGITKLDRRVVPLTPGNFCLVGGASGAGKSTVLRNFIRYWMGQGEKTALFSLEMGGDEQLPNFACMSTAIDVRWYVENRLSPAQRVSMIQECEKIRDSGLLTINERSNQTPDSILRAMKRYRATGHRIFVIDHLHRVTYGEKPGEEIRLHIAAFAKALKSFAVDHSCIVVAGVQYIKMPPNTEPDDSSIREANNILEEADRVLHVWRPLVICDREPDGELSPRIGQNGERIFKDKGKKGELVGEDPHRVYLKIGKQRIRPVGGLVAVHFNRVSGLLYEVEEDRRYGAAA